MTDETSRPNRADRDETARRLAAAGARPPLPADDLARLREATRVAWAEAVTAQGTARRGTGRRVLRWAAAVLVLGLGLAAGWWLGPGTAPGPTVARVLAAGGAVGISAAAGGGGPPGNVPPASGIALPDGSEVVTGPSAGGDPEGWITLGLRAGGEVRLAPGSRLRLASPRLLELERGAVYIDSGEAAGQVRVRTPVAEVRDVGTRFAVRVVTAPEPEREGRHAPSAAGSPGLRVWVRDGGVRIDLGEREVPVAGGEEVAIGAGGAVARGRVAFPDGAPEWVLDAAPPFALEGRRMGAFLDRVAAETGWRIVFADPDLEATARRVELHGDTGSLPPHRALFVVLPGAGLEGEVADGVLTLHRAGEPPARAPR